MSCNNNMSLKRKRNNDKAIAIVYGRLNPPTRGHKSLINQMIEENPYRTRKVLVTHTQNKKNNPLKPEEKVNILRNMIDQETLVNLLQLMHVLQNLKGLFF